MVKTIVLFIAHPKNDNKHEFYKSLDTENEEVKMNLTDNDVCSKITKLYTSPYRSTIEMSKIIKKYYEIKKCINIENSLYDVLDSERYSINNCYHYFKDHFRDRRPYIRGTLQRKDNGDNLSWSRDNKRNKDFIDRKIFNNNDNSIMVCNIKYNETDTDIVSRIGPFIYKLTSNDENETVGLITHSSLKDNIINYVKWYNSFEGNTVRIYVNKMERITVRSWEDVTK